MAFRFSTAHSLARHLRLTGIVAIAAITALTAVGSGASAKNSKEATAPREAGEPIMAIVSIKSQQITFYDADGWISKAPVSTGVKGRETPAGVFAVLQKNREHYSSLYDDAAMPHMQRLTWNGIAFHGGPLPGYAASHGCVRMPYGFARNMFDKTRMGMRVIVSPDDAEPVAFTHPALLEPDAALVGAMPERAETLARAAAEAEKAAAETKKAAKQASRDAKSSAAALRKAERRKSAADDDLAAAEKALERAKSDKAKAKAEAWKTKAETRAAEAAAKLEAAKAEAAPKADAAAKAEEAAKEAATRKVETAKAASDAKLALEPVSVYISRATQKLYVRRNTQKPWPDGGVVYDFSIEVPVTIQDPDKPIGTHIFTAMANDGDALRWSAVTIDNGDDARSALDRIEIPKDVLDRIAPTALPRSSIIVSDEPLSRETNYRTEFVAVLSNHPQGGFKTRKPTVSTTPESAQNWQPGFFGFFGQPNRDARNERRRRRTGKPGMWW